MRAIDPNYEPPSQEFTQFPDGKHKIKGFEWFTLDANKNPILVAQKDGRLVGRLRFMLIDGKQGPPMSVTLPEMPLLARAFKVNVSKAPQPNQSGLITQYMQEIENACADKELDVVVSKGWVNTVKGMEVPDDYFYFVLCDVNPKDDGGNPYAREGQYGFYFFCEFEVVAGEGGSDTPYKGARFTELVNYSVEVIDGKPDWEKSPVEKVYTSAGKRLSNLVRLSAPSMNFLDQDYQFNNPHNILPDWYKMALQDRAVLKGNRIRNEETSRIQLSWPTLSSADYSEGTKETKEESNLAEADVKARQILSKFLDHVAGSKSVENGNLTDEGKKLAKKYFAPLKQEGKIQHGSFMELDYDEVMTIFNVIQAEHSSDEASSLKEDLIFAGVGFERDVVGDIKSEWEDSPF